MFEAGNILHGCFDLGYNGKKNKFAVVLYNDSEECIITTFTTSQLRSSVTTPTHGKNPKDGIPMSYVFKSNVAIGIKPSDNSTFSFKKDTTVVPDYGINESTISSFNSSVDNLEVVCKLYNEEYSSLIYTLYQCKKTKRKYKAIFEKILQEAGDESK